MVMKLALPGTNCYHSWYYYSCLLLSRIVFAERSSPTVCSDRIIINVENDWQISAAVLVRQSLSSRSIKRRSIKAVSCQVRSSGEKRKKSTMCTTGEEYVCSWSSSSSSSAHIHIIIFFGSTAGGNFSWLQQTHTECLQTALMNVREWWW